MKKRARETEEDLITSYLNDISKIPMLSRNDEIATARAAAAGSKEARDKLVTANLRFVIKIAKKYQKFGIPLTDLISEGNIGLLKAIDHFNVDREVHFITYAVWWIRQSIMRAVAEKSKFIRIPLSWSSQLVRLERARYMVQDGQAKSEDDLREIGKLIGLNPERIKELIAVGQDVLSLDQPAYYNETTRNVIDTLEDRNSFSPEQYVVQTSLKNDLNKLLNSLPEREALIIKARYGIESGEPMSLEEVGRCFNLTKEGVRQLELKAIQNLRMPSKLHSLYGYVA